MKFKVLIFTVLLIIVASGCVTYEEREQMSNIEKAEWYMKQSLTGTSHSNQYCRKMADFYLKKEALESGISININSGDSE